MTRVVRSSNNSRTAVFGAIDMVASAERQRLFGPDPEPVEVQVARYQAGEEARRIVDEALEMAESIRRETQASGYQAGWSAGYAEGRSHAEREVADEMERFRFEYRQELQTFLERIGELTTAQWLEAESQVVALALDIARKVVKNTEAVNPAFIVDVVKNALRHHVSSGESETVRIRVNAEDLELVRAAREDILSVIDCTRSLDIIEDRRISRGGCVVETASGTIDATLETQFRTIEENFHQIRQDCAA